MLRWRLLFGTLFIAALIGLCWLDVHATRPGVYLFPLAIVVSLAGAGELLAMMRQRDASEAPAAWVVYGGVLVTVLAAGAPAFLPVNYRGGPIGTLGWLAIGLAAALAIAIVDELRRYESPGRAMISLAQAALAILYIGGLVGFLVQLRLLGSTTGMVALASLIATVKMSDTGQYFVGRMFGQRKLAPKVSPGKTWEGVAGGVGFAVVGAGAALWIGGKDVGIASLLCFAVTLTAAGIVGDLAESLLKRDVGVKDSSTWLPGFGGVLDMLDSLLVAGPVAYLFWALGLGELIVGAMASFAKTPANPEPLTSQPE